MIVFFYCGIFVFFDIKWGFLVFLFCIFVELFMYGCVYGIVDSVNNIWIIILVGFMLKKL